MGEQNGLITYERELRGIPLWLIREYLQELGGKSQGSRIVQGDGWMAQLTQMDDFRVGSILVGQVQISIEADPQAFERLKPGLDKKLLRAGG